MKKRCYEMLKEIKETAENSINDVVDIIDSDEYTNLLEELSKQKEVVSPVMSSRLRKEIEKLRNIKLDTAWDMEEIEKIIIGIKSAISCEEISET